MRFWEPPPKVLKCWLTIGFGPVLLFAGCGGPAERAEKGDGNQKMVTVHIDGFKKSESGAI
jgi:hypothetical protein